MWERVKIANLRQLIGLLVICLCMFQVFQELTELAGFIWQRVGDGLLKECTKERDSAGVWTPNLVFVALKDSMSIFLA